MECIKVEEDEGKRVCNRLKMLIFDGSLKILEIIFWFGFNVNFERSTSIFFNYYF